LEIPVFYCHAPDKQTPIADQAAAMDAEYRKGSFEKLGVSNFSAEMLSEWLQVAEEKGFVKPSVYQGQYNLLCRNHEKALFPLLRKHNISFVAYSPTAGGFLTGKLTFSKSPKDLVGTRFEESPTNFGGMMYRGYYDKPAMHEALKKASSACAKHNVALAEAALRWLLYHSTLSSDAGDGVIVGPSKMSQLDSCVAARDAGKLPGDLAQELDSLWDASVQEAAAPITVI
jgi:aflatoxin B1 aldehyde reductase